MLLFISNSKHIYYQMSVWNRFDAVQTQVLRAFNMTISPISILISQIPSCSPTEGNLSPGLRWFQWRRNLQQRHSHDGFSRIVRFSSLFELFSHVWTIIFHALIWYLISTRMVIDLQVTLILRYTWDEPSCYFRSLFRLESRSYDHITWGYGST